MIYVRVLTFVIAVVVLALCQAGAGMQRQAEAAFPGNNGKILFKTIDGWHTVNPDGTDQTPFAIAQMEYPAWSADGQEIAFSRFAGNVQDVWMAKADGGDEQLVVESAWQPAWSPDGSKIVFVRFPQDCPGNSDASGGGISVVDIGNGPPFTTSILTEDCEMDSPNREAFFPQWSPDGTQIYFLRWSPVSFEYDVLYAIGANGGPIHRVAEGYNAVDAYSISPGGEEVVLYGRKGDIDSGDEGVFVYNLADEEGRKVREYAQARPGLSWSPDGERIAFISREGDSGAGNLQTMNPLGGDVRTLATNATTPAWAADGGLIGGVEFTQGIQQLQSIGGLQESLGGGVSSADATPQAFPGTNGRFAFSNTVGSQPHVNTSAIDGSDVRDLGVGYLPVWSPDGNEIAYADTSTNPGVGIMDADGQNRHLAVSTTTSPNGVHWSPDGSRLVYATTEGGQSYLAVVDRTGANEDVLESIPLTEGLYASPRWSPDGSHIAFSLSEETSSGFFEADVWLIKPDGSDLHRLTNFPNGASAYYLDWSPDATELVVTLSQAGGSGLYAVDRFGHVGTIKLTSGGPSGPAWSPDGERIAYHLGPITIVNRDGSGAVTLPVGGISNYGLDWQPIPQVTVEFTQGIQELQAVSVLESDLEGDGAPPVPIVAGKPAAMRVYFNDVDATTVYEVEATGDVNGSRFVELTPGCTAAERRSGENPLCKSLDFYFTPPEGDWSTTLKVRRQQDSLVLEEHEFNLTSVKTNPLIIKPVTVCDHLNPGTGLWNCGSLFDFVNLLPFLRATFPGEVIVAGSSSTIFLDTAEVGDPAEWWQALGDNVRALWTAEGAFDNLNHYGVVRPQADAGTTGGVAFTEANAAAGRTSQLRDDTDGGLPEETAHELLAHLIGVNLGLGYAPSSGGCYGEPATVDPGWPGASPEIGEVGFDVAAREPIPDTHADWMSLCTPRWISPYTANNVIDAFRVSPASASVQAAGLTQGDFWLVSGLLDEDADTVEFDPLFQLETEGSDEEGTGLYRIEVRDGSDAVLFTRFLKVDHPRFEDDGEQAAEGEAIVRFAELIPVQANAAKIVMFSLDQEVGTLVLGGATPVVQLSSGASSAAAPAGAPPPPVFSWSVEDTDTSDHTFWVELSRDNGQTWQTIAPRFAGTSLTIDPAIHGGGDTVLLRVRASDGVNTGTAVSEPFSMQRQAPHGAFTAPASGSTFDSGDLVWFQAGIVDAEDGFLDGASVQWSSSRDGSLGTGASLPVYDLSSGSHTISMTAQDSDGFDLADSITITVEAGAGGDDHTWGDNDCDGGITTRDNQALLRKVLAQAPLSQTPPCPALGDVVAMGGIGDKQWGDLDCDGAITSRDNQAMLRKVLQQAALSQTPPCPVLGDQVTTTGAAVVSAGTRPRIE